MRKILTRREIEILELLSQGKSNSTIGSELEISVNTVKTHVKKVFTKLKVKSRSEATFIFLTQMQETPKKKI